MTTSLRCGGGASGILVSSTARDAGIAGLEFLRGIPGTVGGFVRMNGGAYGREVSDILVSARLVLRSGEVVEWPIDRLGYTYRHSEVARRRGRGRGACSAARPATPRRSAPRWTAIARAREESQPLRSRTGGSTFKNPPGHKAWALIDAAGCRGLTDRRRPSLGKALQFPAQPRQRDKRRDRGAGRGSAAPGRGENSHQTGMGNPAGRQRMNKDLHIVVLMGGWSAEREVSLTSGKGVADALRERGWSNVTELDMDRDVARAARRAQARRRLQRASRHAGRGRHGPGHDGPDGPSLHPQRARDLGHRDRQGADQDGARAPRHPHAGRADRRRARAFTRKTRCLGPMC